MICRHCGIEFDTSGITGDSVRCPRCGMLYRRKAPPPVQDPRESLAVPVFIAKGPASRPASPPPPVQARVPAAVPPGPRQFSRPAVTAQAAPRGYESRNGYPGGAGPGAVPGRVPVPPKKKTHHVRTALLLFLAISIALIVLTLTGIGDIFPRAAEKDEVPAQEEQVTEETPAEDEWFG